MCCAGSVLVQIQAHGRCATADRADRTAPTRQAILYLLYIGDADRIMNLRGMICPTFEGRFPYTLLTVTSHASVHASS